MPPEMAVIVQSLEELHERANNMALVGFPQTPGHYLGYALTAARYDDPVWTLAFLGQARGALSMRGGDDTLCSDVSSLIDLTVRLLKERMA